MHARHVARVANKHEAPSDAIINKLIHMPPRGTRGTRGHLNTDDFRDGIRGAPFELLWVSVQLEEYMYQTKRAAARLPTP